jgi:hypothetical protein
VAAPVEWVWDNYPVSFDLVRIFGVDSHGRPIRNGAYGFFISEDFPEAGS